MSTTGDATPTPQRTAERFTCSGCDATWGGQGRAHCAGCHRSFSTAGLFDLHRSAHGERGGCKDPATITDQSGQRVLFLRDGLWRGPEMTADQKAARWGGEAA